MPVALRHLTMSAAVLLLFGLPVSAAEKWIRLRSDVNQARTRLEKVLAATPDNVAALTALARIEFSQNQPAKGLPLLERAAPLSPDDPGVHVMLGHRLA